MSDKSSDKGRYRIADWKRPTGPTNVWRIVEGFEKLADGTVGAVRFSIQEVPEERFPEAIEHMIKYFVADEATCKSLKLKDDQDALDDFRSVWNYVLKIGICVGAFKLDDNEKLLKLVGVNMLFVITEKLEKEIENIISNFKSTNAKKIFHFMNEFSKKADVHDVYGNEKHVLSALGLSVSPDFRGQKLGLRLLEARDDIGRKYEIGVTETIFTAPSSQIQAERAGFVTLMVQEYSQLRDENGEPLFPNIEHKNVKMMIKRLL